MREFVLLDDQKRFLSGVMFYAFASRQHLNLLGLLEVVAEAPSDVKKEFAENLIGNGERQTFDWRAEIEDSFVNSGCVIGATYADSFQRIFECSQLFWSACRRSEYVHECRAALIKTVEDRLWLQGKYDRRGARINEHALALIVGAIFTRYEKLCLEVAGVVHIDPLENAKYPLYEHLASFLAFAFKGDWQAAEKLIAPLSKYKMKFRPRAPSAALLKAMTSQNRKKFEKAMREISSRHESTLREFGKIYVDTPERFEFEFGGLNAQIRMPNIDIACVLIMSNHWPDLQPDLFWIPKRLLEAHWD